MGAIVTICLLLGASAAPSEMPTSELQGDDSLPPEVSRQTLLVLNIQARKGVDEDTTTLLTELLLTELAQTTDAIVVGERDILAILEREQAAQLVGCDTDACIAEFAGAYGATDAVHSTVGMLGGDFVLSVKLIDARRGHVKSRWTEKLGSRPEDLPGGVRAAVLALYGKPHPAPTTSETHRRVGPWPWVSGIVGLGAVAAGVGLGYQARKNLGYSVVDSRRSEDRSRAERQLRVANASFGVGAAALVASVVLFVRGGPRSKGSKSVVVPQVGAGVVGVHFMYTFSGGSK